MIRCLVLVCSVIACVVVGGAFVCLADDPPPTAAPDVVDVFALPRSSARQQQVDAAFTAFVKDKQYAEAEKLLADVVARQSGVAVNFYNLACVQALQGKTDAALVNLEAAVTKGFLDLKTIEQDVDLQSLRETEKYKSLIEIVKKRQAEPSSLPVAEPRLVKDQVALVGPENTAWDPQAGMFSVAFRFADDDPRKKAEAVTGHGKAGELIRQWQNEGTAAGLFGILYDNHDRDHSNLPVAEFPQLTGVEFTESARKHQVDYGLQARILFNRPTIGNSSTARTNGAFWRSQTRSAQVNAHIVAAQARQYFANHLYFYPEHRDYDPGRNGQNDGYGDVFPTNTPYTITSQGSSGSDLAFMHAVTCTLAALRPETQAKLAQHGQLMSAVQMIFRMSNKQVAQPADYLTGKAHPAVFNGEQLDVEKMVTLAHDIQSDATPPVALVQVTEEEQPQLGVDYFEAAPAEKLFDTPAAIARVYRTTAKQRRMVVSAAASHDLNGKPLTYTWVVLQGRADAITIKPLKDDGSVVELIVPWHERMKVAGNDSLETNRVDIGLFVHNGVRHSAPAFITHYFLDSEQRTYNEQGRIQSVAYRSQSKGGNYSDPALHTPRDFVDVYRYDAQGRGLGWTRTRGEAAEEFTSHGLLIVDKDPEGRAKTAKKVTYVAVGKSRNEAPALEERPGDEVISYEYADKNDLIGRPVVKPQ